MILVAEARRKPWAHQGTVGIHPTRCQFIELETVTGIFAWLPFTLDVAILRLVVNNNQPLNVIDTARVAYFLPETTTLRTYHPHRQKVLQLACLVELTTDRPIQLLRWFALAVYFNINIVLSDHDDSFHLVRAVEWLSIEQRKRLILIDFPPETTGDATSHQR